MKLLLLVCTANYLPRAQVLANSFLQHHPGYTVATGIVDRIGQGHPLQALAKEMNAVFVEEIGIPDFHRYWQCYTRYELVNAVKPAFARYLLAQRYPQAEWLLYLDADTHLFAPFTDLEAALGQHAIVLSPYLLSPVPQLTPVHKLEYNFDNMRQVVEERLMLYVGVFNGGLWAVRNSAEGPQFLDWWAERALQQGYSGGRKLGQFGEQLWLNLVPLYFPKAHIFRHLGYNMAVWNLHERRLVQRNGALWVNNQVPLAMFHFSGFDPQNPQVFNRWIEVDLEHQRPDLKPALAAYLAALDTGQWNAYQHLPCHFDTLKQAAAQAAEAALQAALPAYRRALSQWARHIWRLLPHKAKNHIEKTLKFALQKINEYGGAST